MKYPKEIMAYNPKLKRHTLHKVKIASKGKARTMAVGNVKHERKLTGHGGKRAGEKTVKKQGKRQKIMLTCTESGYKQERVIGTRTKKKIEIGG